MIQKFNLTENTETRRKRKDYEQQLCVSVSSVRKFFLLSFFFFLSSFVIAQEAAELEKLLNTKAVTYQQAIDFITAAADTQQNNWLPKNAMPNDTINLKQTSLLIMQAFKIKGGPMYSITKSAHYAYRELVYQDIIQGRTDPSMPVSGELLLFIVNRVLYMQDPNPWEPFPPQPEETQ